MSRTQPRFTALTFGRRIAALASELEALGTTVLSNDSAAELIRAVDEAREVSVLLISSDAGRVEAAAVLTSIKERYAALPIVWLGDELGGAPLGDFRSSPDVLLHEPVSALAVHQSVCELLRRPHADTTATLLVSALGTALEQSYMVSATPSAVLVNATHRLVGEINSIVAFCGAGISGSLVISADEATLLRLYAQVVPDSSRAGRHQAEDLAGEIANLAIGKLKYALDQLGVICEIGTPLLVGTAGTILRRTHAQPSLAVELRNDLGIVRGELTIDRCDDRELQRLADAPELAPAAHDAELCFL